MLLCLYCFLAELTYREIKGQVSSRIQRTGLPLDVQALRYSKYSIIFIHVSCSAILEA